jgi:hypothetical protein
MGAKRLYLFMDEIKIDVQGIRMAPHHDGMYNLILIASNAMWADILQHTFGESVVLGYNYDGYDITFYLVLELPGINKMFRMPVNASFETRKWLNLIDERKVTAIHLAYRDGKGGTILFGKSVKCSVTL